MNKLKTGQNSNNKLNSFCQDLVHSQLWKEFTSKIKHFWEKSEALAYCLEEHKEFKLRIRIWTIFWLTKGRILNWKLD